MNERSRAWPITILASSAAAAVAVYGGLGAPAQPLAAGWFLLICPGMALIRPLRLAPLEEATLALAASITLVTLTALLLLMSGAWSPRSGLTILLAVAVGGAGAELAAPAWARRRAPTGRALRRRAPDAEDEAP
jgi:hypothetical protein